MSLPCMKPGRDLLFRLTGVERKKRGLSRTQRRTHHLLCIVLTSRPWWSILVLWVWVPVKWSQFGFHN